MKLSILKILIAGLLAFTGLSAVASPQRVFVIWPFGPGQSATVYTREIITQANLLQNKYQFIFDLKPGAGGTIAARHVLAQKSPIILLNSSAHFIRPKLYPETSYNLDDFNTLILLGYTPTVLVTKNKDLSQLLAKKKINVATPGPGTAIHLMSEVFVSAVKKKYPGKDVVMIHYNASEVSYNAVNAGHADMTFDYVSTAIAGALPSTRLIGVTGSAPINGIPTLSSLGFPDMVNQVGVFALYVPKTVPQETVEEFRGIFLKAELSKSVTDAYQFDYTSKPKALTTQNDLDVWYKKISKDFDSYTKGIEIRP